MDFKNYLILEKREYLADRIGDILTGVQELLEAGKQIGARQLVKNSQSIVNQIRRVLHSTWSRGDTKYLKMLQKAGVALAKTIDEKGDLRDTLQSVDAELNKILDKLGVPLNQLGSPGTQVQEPVAPQE